MRTMHGLEAVLGAGAGALAAHLDAALLEHFFNWLELHSRTQEAVSFIVGLGSLAHSSLNVVAIRI
jgi:hypothetical protein